MMLGSGLAVLFLCLTTQQTNETLSFAHVAIRLSLNDVRA